MMQGPIAAAGIASLRYDERTRVFGQCFEAELPNGTMHRGMEQGAVVA